MIADKLAAWGVPPRVALGAIVAEFALVQGLLAALFPSAVWLPPVLAFLAALAALVDPNSGHGTAQG